MRIYLSFALITLTTIIGHGQSFLSKYPELTAKNLKEFFTDWKAYSDSVSSNNVIADSLIADIIMWNNSAIESEDHTKTTSKYIVSPQIISVERYYLDVDTVMAKYDFGFPDFIPDLKDEQYVVDSVTPVLPCSGLYLTKKISWKLSKFSGGLKNGDTLGEINQENVNELKKYIPVDYGHWGGYWWFTTFPIITHISYADNLIAVMRRTSWWTGDVIWYVNENGKFKRRPEPIISWCE